MKKLILGLLSLILLVGCSANGDAEPSETSDDAIHIGVLQLMEHESLDQAYEGFKDALSENGYEVEYDYQNPNNDRSTLATMAQVLVNEEPDLILAIGTGSAQALQAETTEIPIIGTAITDYVEVKLVSSNEVPGGNISGSSDFVDVAIQMDLVEEFVGEVKTIGLLYSSSEENSIVQAEAMKEECAKRGWEVDEKTISDLTMVNDAMVAFGSDIDALYIPTDNPLASSMASVDIVAKENKVPVFVGWVTGVNDGALASIGINYYKLGYQSGLDAIKVLEGEVNISELPIYFMDINSVDVYYNSDTAEIIEIEIPENIISDGIDLAQ